MDWAVPCSEPAFRPVQSYLRSDGHGNQFAPDGIASGVLVQRESLNVVLCESVLHKTLVVGNHDLLVALSDDAIEKPCQLLGLTNFAFLFHSNCSIVHTKTPC